MNICVYGKYKVKCVNKYDVQEHYDYGVEFNTYTERFTRTKTGSELIALLNTDFNRTELLEYNIHGNEITFMHFNPHDGTSQTITYTITEIKENKNGDGKRTKNSRKVNKNNP